MKRTRTLAFISVLLIGIFAFSGIAAAQRAPGGQRQSGDAAIAGLIDVVVNNTQALNNLSVLSPERFNNFQVVNLNDVLNGNQTNVLSNILNNSEVLSRNTVVVQDILNNSLNGNTILQDFLNQNNIAVDRVVAVDVLSAPTTIYVFNPR